jgi:hypothetical protein
MDDVIRRQPSISGFENFIQACSIFWFFQSVGSRPDGVKALLKVRM